MKKKTYHTQKQDMKSTYSIVLWATVIFSLLLHGCNGSDREEKTSSAVPAADAKQYVAHVNGDGITVDDLQWYLTNRPNTGRSGNGDDFVKNRFQELVSMKILTMEAKQRKIDQAPAMKFAIEQMLANALLEEEVNKPILKRKISDQEVEEYYNMNSDTYNRPKQIRLADIFLAVPQDAPAAIRDLKEQQAKTILAQALRTSGERFAFAELIKEKSDKHPLYNIGDTGFFDKQGKPQKLAADFVREAFTLNDKGRVHDKIIKSTDGFHIVMLVGDRPARNIPIEKAATEIRQKIRHNEINKKREQFIQALAAKASLEVSADKINGIIKEESR